MKKALVTGGTSGIGAKIAEELVKAGFDVTVTGRDPQKGEEAASALGARFVAVDHTDLDAVRALADRVGAVDVLVNNVGGAFWKRSTTDGGLERTLALNLAAPVVLTEALLPSMSRGARIVNVVTKLEHKMHLDLEDPQGERRYGGFDAYAGAKVALLAWTRDLAARLEEAGIVVAAVHPGIVLGTSFGADMPWLMRAIGPVAARLFGMARSLDDAARTPVWLATADDAVSKHGAYLDLDRELPLPDQVKDPAQVRRILDLCASFA